MSLLNFRNALRQMRSSYRNSAIFTNLCSIVTLNYFYTGYKLYFNDLGNLHFSVVPISIETLPIFQLRLVTLLITLRIEWS